MRIKEIDYRTKNELCGMCKAFSAWFRTYADCTNSELFNNTEKAKEALTAYRLYLDAKCIEISGMAMPYPNLHTYLWYLCLALGIEVSDIIGERKTE